MRALSRFAAFALVACALAACSGKDTTAASTACAGGTTHAAIVTSLGFTREKPMGVAPGFVLDGHATDMPSGDNCSHSDLVDPDGNTGIDNQLATLIPVVEKVYKNAVDGLVQGAINNGVLVILLEMQNVDSLKNDGCVNLDVQLGKGSVLLGTDGVIEGFQTFDLDPKSERSVANGGKIKDGVMTAGPFDLALPIAIFDVSFTLHLKGAMFRYTIDPDGFLDGHLGGGIVIQELLDGVSKGAGVAKTLPLIQLALNAAADLAPDADGVCRQLSAALAFKAAPAFIRH